MVGVPKAATLCQNQAPTLLIPSSQDFSLSSWPQRFARTPTRLLMATAVATQRLTVALAGEEHELTVLSFIDRRGRRPHRRKQWVLVRSIERLLFGVRDGARSTGALVAHLNKCTLGDAVLTCERARVNDKTLTDDELLAGTSYPQTCQAHLSTPLSGSRKPTCVPVLAAMRPMVGLEDRNRLRKVSVLPITVAASALTEFGRCDATSALLTAMNKVRQHCVPSRSAEHSHSHHGPSSRTPGLPPCDLSCPRSGGWKSRKRPTQPAWRKTSCSLRSLPSWTKTVTSIWK